MHFPRNVDDLHSKLSGGGDGGGWVRACPWSALGGLHLHVRYSPLTLKSAPRALNSRNSRTVGTVRTVARTLSRNRETVGTEEQKEQQ